MIAPTIRDPEGAKPLLAKRCHGDIEEKEEMQIQANVKKEIYDRCQCRWISKVCNIQYFFSSFLGGRIYKPYLI